MATTLPPDLTDLLRDQAGLAARRQLTALGLRWDRVQTHVDAGRWVARTPRVISTVTGTLDTEQLRWLAVLHAGPRSMLGGLSAAAVHGLTGWDRATVTVLVDDELAFEPVSGMQVVRCRRPFEVLRSPRPGVPTCRLEPALLLWAAYSAPTERTAQSVLAAAVQQRLTTAERLSEWVDRLRPLRRAQGLRAALHDVADGAHSGAELDLGRLCERWSIPPPRRQVPRTDRDGAQRWSDAEWDLDGGRTLVLEVDGGFHQDVQQAAADARRSRRLTEADRTVVRCTAHELRHEPDQVAADLLALGVPGRVPDDLV